MAKRVNGEAEPNGQEESMRSKIRGFIAQAASIGLNLSPSDLAGRVSKQTGIKDEKWVRYTTIEIINKLHYDRYVKTPKKDRIVFIPHCLRNIKACKATSGEEGFRCAKCGGCVIEKIVSECEKNGMKYFMVGGGSIVLNIIENHKPKAVLGVACYNELKMALEKTGEKNIITQVVLLSKDGCINTEVDLNEVIKKINL
ncbi:MAG: DUF116 domain-containing protein [Candidatus Micrarchaeota archaeon]